jgi:hypothetical protein
LAKRKRAQRRRVDLVAVGSPRVFNGAAIARALGSDRELYALDIPCVAEDVDRGRIVELSVVVDGGLLRQLVASARAAGWRK